MKTWFEVAFEDGKSEIVYASKRVYAIKIAKLAHPGVKVKSSRVIEEKGLD